MLGSLRGILQYGVCRIDSSDRFAVRACSACVRVVSLRQLDIGTAYLRRLRTDL
jgi:hypothetical protein